MRHLHPRLEERGIEPDSGWLGSLTDHSAVLPDWFRDNGNVLLSMTPLHLPVIAPHPGIDFPSNAVIALGPNVAVSQIMLWGDDARVALGPNVQLPGGIIACGGASMVWLGKSISCMTSPTINVRNGGVVYVEGDGLWSSGVKIFSDDMHAIRDVESGERLNPFGGVVIVERHVWLGFEVMLLPGAHVGHDCVVGARATVTMHIPPHSVCVGSPARIGRQGVTWTYDDLP